jgi:hypothetical protein
MQIPKPCYDFGEAYSSNDQYQDLVTRTMCLNNLATNSILKKTLELLKTHGVFE